MAASKYTIYNKSEKTIQNLRIFKGKSIVINFKIITLKINITLKQKIKICYQITQIKHCRHRNVIILSNRQINK